jgi:hypothetical protein
MNKALIRLCILTAILAPVIGVAAVGAQIRPGGGDGDSGCECDPCVTTGTSMCKYVVCSDSTKSKQCYYA